jgi:hypothetical protein
MYCRRRRRRAIGELGDATTNDDMTMTDRGFGKCFDKHHTTAVAALKIEQG